MQWKNSREVKWVGVILLKEAARLGLAEKGALSKDLKEGGGGVMSGKSALVRGTINGCT